MKEIERIQRKALKRIFKLPVSTTYTGILMETGIWPAEVRIKYASLMLYYNIKNSNEERKIKRTEQGKKNYSNTVEQQIAKTLEIEIDKVTGTKSQHGKMEVDEKVTSKIKKRMIEEMAGRT